MLVLEAVFEDAMPYESVRLYLACWLQKYCASWFDRDQDQQSIFSKAFLEKILQIIVRYLTDEPNVRASTFESLTYLIEKGYLDRATTIKLNIVEELVSKPINEQFMDMCTNYIHLMVKIAPLVGCAKTHELLYTRFVKMCTCKINFVRKECATAFPVMCEVLGNEVFEKNLQAGGGSTGSGITEPSPTAATGGETGPSSAAMVVEDNENQNDSDSSYGSINNNETDNNKLIYMYEDLLPSQSQSSTAAAAAAANSSNNNAGASTAAGAASGGAGSSSSTVTPTMTTVERIRAAEQLKTLIRWENEEVEWNLLEDFLHMKNVNMELCQDCAYNFPAVVLTFGDKFWPILSRYFFDLCGDVQDSVRRTMAASISKIALIIGREQATRDLVPSYTEFLLDSDDIKFEVVRTLAEFLRVIDACEHETLMNHLGMCLQPPLSMMNWRFRELVGQQIMELARMHTAIRKENCLLFLTGLSMRLMLDKYDSVRKAGIDAFVECSHEFQQNDKVFEFFNKHFASYSNWRRRQTYVIAAGKMLETDRVEVKIFRKHVFNNVLKLADDAVPNVRIQVAKCLKEIIAPHPNFANDPQVEPTLQKLRTDKDCDVRGHIDGYQSLEEEMAAGGGCGGSGASNASTMMMTSGDSESHHESSSSSSSPSPSPSPSAARSLTNSSVSLRLSYAEATSGFSSLMLDDQQFYSGEQQQQRHQRQQQADEERELKDGEGEEVQLAAGAGATGACSSERGVDVANVEMHGGAGAGMVERHNDHDNDEDDECGEEAIEQPTSSMSTDDDAAYCSEMETSSAVSTPSAAPAATLATIPSQNVPLPSG
uniref:Serine/threonine-protein phosphatase 4 regulatory subunit 1 n=1 Tax=Anopheles coluzzii TaxID=1518534 RepID=A0A8W7PHG1_ANOCL